MPAYFDLPLNLPHAGTVAIRIYRKLASEEPTRAQDLSLELVQLLAPSRIEEENPPMPEAEEVRRQALFLGRELVDEIEKLSLSDDRLGQCVRNLFECLQAGAEGAQLSLRAGENPDSMLRPYPPQGESQTE